MKDKILNYLKTDERFRFRKNKNKGIANLLAEKYHIEIPKDKRDDFIADVLSADRCWRKSLEDFPELRGADYDQKEVLEQTAQISLGYLPHGNENLKTFKTL